LVNALRSRAARFLTCNIAYFGFATERQNPTQPITLRYWYDQKIRGINRDAYWPVHPNSLVVGAGNILVGKGSFPGYMPGCYIQGIGLIVVGKYSIFASNVGLISANHNIYNNAEHIASEIVLGSYCWVGMNSTILPGVVLGDYTIVAAGSVVSKSFPDGYCVVGGVPARVIKHLEREKCVHYEMPRSEYRGYIRDRKFLAFAQRKLNPKLFHRISY